MKRQSKPMVFDPYTPWLCRTIGHRWLTRRRVRVDDMSTTYPVLLTHCARCGHPSPVQLREVRS